MSDADWFTMFAAVTMVSFIIYLLIVIYDTDKQWHDDDRDKFGP